MEQKEVKQKLEKEFTDKNMRFENIKTFWEMFAEHIQPEDVIEEIKIRNNYISAKLKGNPNRIRYYYVIDAGVLAERRKRL